MGWLDKLGKKIETAVNNTYPVGTTYYGGMSGAGNMNLSKIEYTANQMDTDEAKEFKKEANTALGVGTAAAVILPFIANGIQAFRTAYPTASRIIDTGLTVDGVRNALSDNGIKKTWNYIKDGNWGRAAASGTMDALDLLGGVGLVGDMVKGWKFAKGAYMARLMNKALESPTSLIFNSDNMYRVIGRGGFEDAMLTGVLRNNINGRSSRGVHFTLGKVNDVDNPIKGFVQADGTLVKLPKDRIYYGDIIAEVPVTHPLFNLFLAHSHPEWHLFKSQNPISVNGVKFYQRTAPNTYIELPHTPLMPQPSVYGYWNQYTDGFNLGYMTSGIKQTGTLYTLLHKSGGTIHIKKKNKGKFTDYCGGKVTEECIRKGKNSSNPTTRKRANFAANARKWKHEEGGKLNYLNIF